MVVQLLNKKKMNLIKNAENNIQICSVCDTEFDEYNEGGTVGNFGMLPVAFCPTCLACCFDMVEQMKEE